MAFDGITMANLAWEFAQSLEGGRIQKIAQPEKDELILTIKGNRRTIRLQISASASLPLIYEASQNKPSPLTAPSFCMLLRKHIGSAKILEVRQPGLERIITGFGTSGRDGGRLPQTADRGADGKAQQHYLLPGGRNHHRQHQAGFHPGQLGP